MTNDSVLSGLALLERTVPQLKTGTREAISKTGIMRIKDGIEKCIEKISGAIDDTLVLSPLLEVSTLIESLLSEDCFVETDAEVKDIIIKALMPAVDRLKLDVGMYYMKNEFTFRPGYEKILIRVINSCIEQGYYFGMEDCVNE